VRAWPRRRPALLAAVVRGVGGQHREPQREGAGAPVEDPAARRGGLVERHPVTCERNGALVEDPATKALCAVAGYHGAADPGDSRRVCEHGAAVEGGGVTGQRGPVNDEIAAVENGAADRCAGVAVELRAADRGTRAVADGQPAAQAEAVGVPGEPDLPQHEGARVPDAGGPLVGVSDLAVGHGEVHQGERAAGGHVKEAEGPGGRAAADPGAARSDDQDLGGDRGQAVVPGRGRGQHVVAAPGQHKGRGTGAGGLADRSDQRAAAAWHHGRARLRG
jgi:hypothetical protein